MNSDNVRPANGKQAFSATTISVALSSVDALPSRARESLTVCTSVVKTARILYLAQTRQSTIGKTEFATPRPPPPYPLVGIRIEREIFRGRLIAILEIQRCPEKAP